MKTCQFLFALTAFAVSTAIDAQTPRLNSNPSAPATIYLNFDGEFVQGTSWNWSGPINAQPAGLPAAAVLEIFNRVAEDYRPFNINITTDSTVYLAAPFNKRSHLVITPTSGWYGSAGGVALVGSFTWGDDTPAWVFSALLFNNPKNIAEACSHEAGHTLGLQHQSSYNAGCVKTAEYNPGQGNGEIGWAPIMGVGYSKNLTTWHTGTSTAGCDVIQNDMDVIAAAGRIGYRKDDYADVIENAASINMQGFGFQINGMINQTTDADVFKLSIGHPSRLRLNAVPQNVGSGNQGANIDIKIWILNAAADTLGSYNPSSLLDAGFDTSLSAGNYYIAVKGTGNINYAGDGSLGTYLMSGSLLSILPLQQFVLKGSVSGSNHLLSWTYNSDEVVRNLEIESSTDGKQFMPLARLDKTVTSFSYRPAGSDAYYRVKAGTLQNTYYSNIIRLFALGHARNIRLSSSRVSDQILFSSDIVCPYQLFDASGRLISTGYTIKGSNSLDIQHVPRGILFIRFKDESTNRIEKLIKQ